MTVSWSVFTLLYWIIFDIEHAAQGLGLPHLSPYLKSIGSDYSHGANFASSASTVIPPFTSFFHSGLSPFSLSIQLSQMKQFKARVEEFHQTGTLQNVTINLHLFYLIMIHSPIGIPFHAPHRNYIIIWYQNPFTRCIQKGYLHVLYWPKWSHFQNSSHW